MAYLTRLVLLFTTVMALLLPVTALADFKSSFHPSICEAVTNQQADRLRWGYDGLKNEDPNMALWVNCPMPIQIGAEDLMWVSLQATNESDRAVDLECVLRWLVAGNPTSTTSNARITPGETEVFRLEIIPLAGGQRFLLQCKLPTDVILNNISVEAFEII